MAERKKTYINSSNKHAVREFLIQRVQFESVVGLAGTDINEYIGYL
jgi:1-deoxy-D-xylulose 5-phosphate reductoisomerase